jgi:hypothetical protein
VCASFGLTLQKHWSDPIAPAKNIQLETEAMGFYGIANKTYFEPGARRYICGRHLTSRACDAYQTLLPTLGLLLNHQITTSLLQTLPKACLEPAPRLAGTRAASSRAAPATPTPSPTRSPSWCVHACMRGRIAGQPGAGCGGGQAAHGAHTCGVCPDAPMTRMGRSHAGGEVPRRGGALHAPGHCRLAPRAQRVSLAPTPSPPEPP